jgi:NDP-sugar pyrophosphorylase family protein
MIWGTEAVKGIEKPEEGYTKKTYVFNSIEERKAFLLGVRECDGWQDHCLVEDLENAKHFWRRYRICQIN